MTTIEWTQWPGTKGETWNPVKGCREISPGCAHCYAKTFAERWIGVKGHAYEHGFTPREAPDQLAAPLSWRAPRTVFVNSMSDLWHEGFSDEYIAAVFGIMAATPRHTYIVLTKRADRMRAWFDDYLPRLTGRQRGIGCAPNTPQALIDAAWTADGERHKTKVALDYGYHYHEEGAWPLPNVILGVTCENVRHGIPRIAALRRTPAHLRVVSFEPLLEDVSPASSPLDLTGIDWAIVGGESGNGARPFSIEWARMLHIAAKKAGAAFFMKQLGTKPQHEADEWGDARPIRITKRKGNAIEDFPADLQVREYPVKP